MTPTPGTDPHNDPRRIAACLQACRHLKTALLELPDAHCTVVLGVKGGSGLCLVVEQSAYDALAEAAIDGAQHIRWFEELTVAIIKHLDPEDTLIGLIPKIERAGRQIQEVALLRAVEVAARATYDNDFGWSSLNAALKALDAFRAESARESEDRNE
jgi:hypothetical protein